MSRFIKTTIMLYFPYEQGYRYTLLSSFRDEESTFTNERVDRDLFHGFLLILLKLYVYPKTYFYVVIERPLNKSYISYNSINFYLGMVLILSFIFDSWVKNEVRKPFDSVRFWDLDVDDLSVLLFNKVKNSCKVYRFR